MIFYNFFKKELHELGDGFAYHQSFNLTRTCRSDYLVFILEVLFNRVFKISDFH